MHVFCPAPCFALCSRGVAGAWPPPQQHLAPLVGRPPPCNSCDRGIGKAVRDARIANGLALHHELFGLQLSVDFAVHSVQLADLGHSTAEL